MRGDRPVGGVSGVARKRRNGRLLTFAVPATNYDRPHGHSGPTGKGTACRALERRRLFNFFPLRWARQRDAYAFSAPSCKPFMYQRCAIPKAIRPGVMAMM